MGPKNISWDVPGWEKLEPAEMLALNGSGSE